jgi:hypothetical protein
MTNFLYYYYPLLFDATAFLPERELLPLSFFVLIEFGQVAKHG